MIDFEFQVFDECTKIQICSDQGYHHQQNKSTKCQISLQAQPSKIKEIEINKHKPLHTINKTDNSLRA